MENHPQINVNVERPNEVALRQEAHNFLDVAQDFEVTSPTDYEFANQQLGQVKGQAKGLDEKRKAITKPLDEAKKQVMDLFRPALDLLNDAERLWKRKMIAWDEEQERKRREEEARLREEQRKEQERLRKQAEAAAKKGREEQAERLREQAQHVPTPVVAAPPESQPKGVSYREDWDFEITDKDAIPRDFFLVDEKKIRGVVKAMKGATNIPGIRAFPRKVMTKRAG